MMPLRIRTLDIFSGLMGRRAGSSLKNGASSTGHSTPLTDARASRNFLALAMLLLATDRSPSRPTTARYAAAATAMSASLVQMLDVAFDLRMCCSLVCSVMQNALLPSASLVRPITRPGILRTSSCRQPNRPSMGPPKFIGEPNDCPSPMTMSAP